MKFLIFIYLFIYLLLWLHVQYTEVLGSGLEYRATAVTYATAAVTDGSFNLCHSHGNTRSDLYL